MVKFFPLLKAYSLPLFYRSFQVWNQQIDKKRKRASSWFFLPGLTGLRG
jgi:hypothetical protein